MGTSSYPKEAIVRSYELTYLLPGTMSDSDVEKAKAEVEALLKKYKAEVTKSEDWGKKPLAYAITHEGKKEDDGVYTHVVFRLKADQAQAFEKDIFLSPRIMRHLLLVSEEEVAVAEKIEKVAEAK